MRCLSYVAMLATSSRVNCMNCRCLNHRHFVSSENGLLCEVQVCLPFKLKQKRKKKIRESHLLTNYSNRPLRSGLLALLPPTHRHPHFLLHTLTSYVIINSLETEIMQEDFTIHRSLALIFLCENTLEVNDFIIGPWH